jgi:ferredoxin-NADP reductase
MANPAKVKATVHSVSKHTDSIVSYRFAPQGRVPKFRAGQFLHLALDDYHPDLPWPESRVFSIASSPSERRSVLAITISVKGAFTERIYNTLEEGSECWLKLPYGDFLFPPGKPLVLIAGGVGITPYLSLMKQMLEVQSVQHVSLYYGVRSADCFLFADLLERCENELPNFRKTIYCEDGTVAGEEGRLDISRIHADTPAESIFYLSGPFDMIEYFRACLQQRGACPEQIVVDEWE